MLAALVLSQHISAVPNQTAASAEGPAIAAAASIGAGIARRQDDSASVTASAGAAGDVMYHGGQVQRSQKVFTIFWNPGAPFPAGYQAAINQFVHDLDGSSYYAIASQYSDGTGLIGGKVTFGGTWLDTTNPFPETALSYSDLAAEVDRAKAANGWTSDANSYFQVYTPSGIVSSRGGICGLHYFSNPAIGQILFPDTGCFPGAPYPHDAVTDAAINTSAHEIMETATDPFGDAWYHIDVSGEISDLCNFGFGARGADGSNVTLGGHPYLLQLQYSNATSSCVSSLTGARPSVFTGVATGIGPSQATLNGTVNPNGLATTAFFQYGPTTAYGAQTPAQTLAANASVTPVSAVISTLACSSVYYVRAVATNSSGTTNGPDQLFKTSGCGSSSGTWTYQDIGAVGIAGNASLSGPDLTMNSAGADIWGPADSFGYMYQAFAGDGEISAGVVGVENTNPFAKGGIMLRATTAANSAFVLVDIRPGGEIEFMARPQAGASVTFIAGASTSFAGPPRLLMTRADGVITAYLGVGNIWKTIGSVPDAMPRGILAGMAVTSHDRSAMNTTVFSAPLARNFTLGLPQGWTDRDVGAVGRPGGSTYKNGVFTVQGAGANIWGTADSFHLVQFAPFPDGSSVVARVTHVDNTNAFAKAGIVLVLDDKAGASNADVVLDVRPTGDVEFMMRPSAGAPTQFLASLRVTTPIWLKLTLTGPAVNGYTSTDGLNWSLIGSAQPDFGQMNVAGGRPFVGLAVTSCDTSRLNTSTFDKVSVQSSGSSGLPAFWTSHDVGVTGRPGSASFAGDIFTVSGAGANIWGTADAFQFVSQSFAVSGTPGDDYPVTHAQVIARVTSIAPTNTFAKAGVMIRDSNDPGSAHVVLDVRPTGDVEFMTRSTGGGATKYIGGVNVALPVWLALVRAGDRVTGSVSTDGVNWTTVGTATAALSKTQTELGIVVNSHDTGTTNRSTFDNVEVRVPQ
jgi:hypothetical protein